MNEPDAVMQAVWNWRQGQVAAPRRWLAQSLILCAGLAVAALAWWFGHQTAAIIVASVAVAIFLISLILPKLYARLEAALLYLSHLVGLALSWLFLTPIFYLCFTAVRLTQIMSRYDPMQRRLAPDASSYWRDKPQDSDPNRYQRQYL
jgi:hypothetical protein